MDSSYPELLVQLVREGANAPYRCSEMAAGFDLRACSGGTIPPNSRQSIPIGVKVALPAGTYGRIAPRSGIAFRSGINVLAGVIDSDYRGELIVILHNTDHTEPFHYASGDRIAQLIVTPVVIPRVHMVTHELPVSARGSNGFGSTGV